MEALKLENIAMNNGTAIEVFDVLSKRLRVLKILDLRRFEYDLNNEGRKIDHEDLIKTFKMLQEAGMGSIVRKEDQPLRFVWTKNHKTISEQALSQVNLTQKKHINNLTDKLQTNKPKRGRPPGSKNKKTVFEFKDKVGSIEKTNNTQQLEITDELVKKITQSIILQLTEKLNGK